MFCHQCGTPVEASARFCAKCGSVLKNEPTIQATAAPLSPSPTENDRNTPQSQLAGRFTRLGAGMLDFLITITSYIPGIVVILASDTDGGKGFGWALLAIAWLGLCVVQIVLLVRHGQSLGKRALGIRIVRVSDESIPGFVKVVLLRAWVPAIIVGAIPNIGVVFGLVDPYSSSETTGAAFTI